MLMRREIGDCESATKDLVRVSFVVKGQIVKGNILNASDPREKIIFVNNYNKFKKFFGLLPKNNEEWLCEVVHDTKEVDPKYGAIFVKLLKNLSKEKMANVLNQAIGLMPIIQHFKNFKGDEDIVQRRAIDAVKLAIKIKVFAETEVVNKKALCSIKEMIGNGRTDCPEGLQFNELNFANQKYKSEGIISWKEELRAIVDWLERPENITDFKDIGQRYLKCGCCGSASRVKKKKYKIIQEGGVVKEKCLECGANSG